MKNKNNSEKNTPANFEPRIDKKNILLQLSHGEAEKEYDIYIGDDYLLSAKSSKKAMIKIGKENKIGRIIAKALQEGESLKVLGQE